MASQKEDCVRAVFFGDFISYLRNGWSVNWWAIENCIFSLRSKELNMRPILQTVCIWPCLRRPLLIYDFTPDTIWLSWYMRKILLLLSLLGMKKRKKIAKLCRVKLRTVTIISQLIYLPNMIVGNNILIIQPTTWGYTLGFHIAVALQKRTVLL